MACIPWLAVGWAKARAVGPGRVGKTCPRPRPGIVRAASPSKTGVKRPDGPRVNSGADDFAHPTRAAFAGAVAVAGELGGQTEPACSPDGARQDPGSRRRSEGRPRIAP